MGLRDDQREFTRTRILQAVLDLVANGALDALSVPAVSRASGVSVATIYRYFPNKDELLAAASAEPSRHALASPDRPAPRPGDDALAGFVRSMWVDFAENMPLLRHQISSTAGREMRRTRLDDGRQRLAAYVAEFGIDPDSADGQRLVSLIMLTVGSLGLVELHDRQGLSVDDAADAALWAVSALIAATHRNTPHDTPQDEPLGEPLDEPLDEPQKESST